MPSPGLRSRRIRSSWKRWALALLALALFAEVVVRLLPAGSALAPAEFGYPQGLWEEDAELGHVLRAGFKGFFTRYEGYPLEIDRQGRRALPGCTAPGERRRLVVIGDGIAFGKYERAEDTFPARLQAALPAVDVDCRAVPFYSLPHYEILLERLLREPLSGAVLLALNPNDLEPLHTHGEVRRALRARGARSGMELPADDPQQVMERVAPLPFPLRCSALANELRKLWWRLDRKAHPYRYDPHRRYARVLLERCDRLESRKIAARIASIARRLHQRGVKLAAITFPDEFQLAGESATSRGGRVPADLFAKACEVAGVPFLDLRKPFLEQTEPTKLIRSNDLVHLSARGHQLVAGLLLAWLREEGIL